MTVRLGCCKAYGFLITAQQLTLKAQPHRLLKHLLVDATGLNSWGLNQKMRNKCAVAHVTLHNL